ncbi:unnamed protein product [Trifolium pratense]|uniref:Uncharacterized protein n=1 Tax=Trifolium pratense TaxID=57577 RepID=A0ACB0IPV8_TRIPR|nr:unnamed protein product [Trifolium pratense]
MASPQNVELEAAKFLHKLIQDSKDEPAKLAAKLYAILQHMQSTGKEHSMPYQVISSNRPYFVCVSASVQILASCISLFLLTSCYFGIGRWRVETMINQHGLDIEALQSSRLPLIGGPQIGTSSQAVGGAKDSRAGLAENEAPKMEPFASGRPPIAPTSGAPDYYQGTVAQRSNQSFDQGSPSSLDSSSANSQSQDRRDAANWDKQVNQKDGKKGVTKRKRGDSTSPVEMLVDGSSPVDPRNTGVTSWKGKMIKVEPSDGIPAKSGEMTNFNAVPNNSQMENISNSPGNMNTMLRANPEGHHLLAKQTDLSKNCNPIVQAPNSKYPEDLEVPSAHVAPAKLQGAYAGVRRVLAGPANVSVKYKPVFSNSMQYGGSLDRDGVSSTTLADRHKISQIGRQNSGSEMTMLRQGVPPRDTGKSPVLVFHAFRNCLPPKKLHLEVAFGTFNSREGSERIAPRNDEKRDHAWDGNQLAQEQGACTPIASPRTIPHVPIPAGTSTLPSNNWRVVLAVDDFGGESSSAWDMQFSGGEVVSQYNTPSDKEKIQKIGFEQSLEAVRTYTLWTASIATETSRILKEEHSHYLSSVTGLRNSLSQAEADNRIKDESLNTLQKTLEYTMDELKTYRERYLSSKANYSKLESELESLRLSCVEKDKKIESMENSALEDFDEGFSCAIQQVEVLHPGIDLTGADSRLIVRGGRVVDPRAKTSFGVVTDP